MNENTCIFNEGVDCNDCTFCSTCGWNPEVEQERKTSLEAARTSSEGTENAD